MSVIRPENHPNPNDPDEPLYYEPQRAVRSEANPEDRFPPTATYRSRFDEMREEAFAKTMRDSLESEFVHEGRQPRLLLAVAGGMAAGIGVSVIAALVFSTWFQSYKKATPRSSSLSLLHRLNRLKQLKRRPNNPKRCFKNSCSGSKTNSSFVFTAGLDCAIAKGWLILQESGTYVRLRQARRCSPNCPRCSAP